jgi:hypothetical protein
MYLILAVEAGVINSTRSKERMEKYEEGADGSDPTI